MAVFFRIKIKPNARKNEITTDPEGNLKAKINAPPVDGKANKELIRFLSDYFEVPKSFIEIMAGETSSVKKIKISGNDKKINELLNRLVKKQ